MKTKKDLRCSIKLFFSCTLVFLLVLFSNAVVGRADARMEQLAQKLKAQSHLGQETLAAPLFMGAPSSSFSPGESLFVLPLTFGTKGNVKYDQMGGTIQRVAYHDLRDPASFFIFFDEEMDLRGRWMEITYSGITVPKKIYLVFDKGTPRSDSTLPIHLNRSTEIERSRLEIPDRIPYSKIKRLDFQIDPKDQSGMNADFLILDVSILRKSPSPQSK